MGNKAPAKATELANIITLDEIKKYFESHGVHEIQLLDYHGNLIYKCLESDMQIDAFNYLLKKISAINVNAAYRYLYPHLTYSDKSLKVIDTLSGTNLVHLIEYTNDKQILDYLMQWMTKKNIMYILEVLDKKYKLLNI